MKKIFGILALSALLFACDTTDETSLSGRVDTIYFDSTSATLNITNQDPGSTSFVVNVSKSASTDRTFNLEVDASSTAYASSYAVDVATLFIPANSITGTVTVDGMYDATIMPSTGTESLVLNLVAGDEVQSTFPNTTPTPKQITVTVNRSCVNPATVPSDYFVGNYIIADVTGTVGPGNGTENFEGGTVTLTVNGTNPNQRDFVTAVFPAFTGSAPVNASIEFTANNGVVLNDLSTGVGCGSSIIFSTAGADNSAWVICDGDDTITVNFIEDDQGNCGGPFVGSSFSLTKI